MKSVTQVPERNPTMAHRTRLTITLASAAAAVTLLVSSAQAGQDESRQPPAAQQDQQQTQTARGTLQDVDVEAKALTVKPADGAEVTIMYTDQTSVTGARGGVSGLGTVRGREVVVQFMMKDADRVATSIEIQPEQ